MKKKKSLPGLIANNKKAKFNYFLKEFYEAGLSLVGTEVKSLRQRNASLDEAQILFRNGSAFIHFMTIPIYKEGNIFNHEPTRPRRLLLHKREILYLQKYIQLHPHNYVVPTKIYFKEGLVKLEIALAESKMLTDKRDTIKKRETERQINRIVKEKNSYR